MKNQTLLITTLWLTTLAFATPSVPGTPKTEPYAEVLRSVVDISGMVDYEGLKQDPHALDTYLEYLSTVPEETVDQWSEPDRIAFYINAYNSLTLKAVIENYPIKPSFFRSRFYPKNSIRQIPGVWKKLKFTVHNRAMTLDHIERKILRGQFNEPRIHMALVRAAAGGPPLRNEPYAGPKLDAQLADQTVVLLANLDRFKIDRKKSIVYLSPIFKWFGKDFVETYAPPENTEKLTRTLSAVMNFVATHADALFRPFLYKGKYKVKYLGYDWSLNEQ